MDYAVGIKTDAGMRGGINQDCALLKTADSSVGKVCFMALCDGMGGLKRGELASAAVIRAFAAWFEEDFPSTLREEGEFVWEAVKRQWRALLEERNEAIARCAEALAIGMGTTAAAALIINQDYLMVNVGDTRFYRITDRAEQITQDHTVVQREIDMGILSSDMAERDSRKNVLLQCVGASSRVLPDFYEGRLLQGQALLGCTDGFRHKLTQQEIYEKLRPDMLVNDGKAAEALEYCISVLKERKERDNITAAIAVLQR